MVVKILRGHQRRLKKLTLQLKDIVQKNPSQKRFIRQALLQRIHDIQNVFSKADFDEIILQSSRIFSEVKLTNIENHRQVLDAFKACRANVGAPPSTEIQLSSEATIGEFIDRLLGIETDRLKIVMKQRRLVIQKLPDTHNCTHCTCAKFLLSICFYTRKCNIIPIDQNNSRLRKRNFHF